MAGVREFLRTPAGKNVAIAAAAVGLAVCVWSVASNLGESDAQAASRERLYVCAETGKPFRLGVDEGARVPVRSPHSGKDTGYVAELCYWTKSGELKREPTPVLLNRYAARKEPTFCPDCGRLVIPQNPSGIPGDKAPPTQAEYKPERAER